MAFIITPNAARVAKSIAESAAKGSAKGSAQATRAFSMASKAKEKKSRRFFPAAVFSGRDERPTFLANAPPLDRREGAIDRRESLQASRRASQGRGSGAVADNMLVGYGAGGARRRKLSVSLLARPAERRIRNIVEGRVNVEGKSGGVLGSVRARTNVKVDGAPH